ncbi:hypothetical protein BH11BAC5_BH11BAC5_14410 [soil metagenome]
MIKKAAYTAVLLLLVLTGNAQVHYTDTVQFINRNTPLPPHPRILLLKGEEAQLKNNIASNPVWQKVNENILLQCDTISPLPAERIMTGIRLLAVSRMCLSRIFYLSYAWRMTHEKKYFDRAEKELLAFCNFSDWNPSHYLDVAEGTTAIAIGYDWLYDSLSAISRKVISEAIRTKGLATSYDTTYPAFKKWLSVTNNWNQVCNTGMTFGALATYEDDPALAVKVINRSIASIDIPMKDYGPDGAFAEGYTYWGYGTTFNVMWLSTIEKVFKTDFGLTNTKGFLQTAAYLENMVGPSGKCFNYSDASEPARLQPAMFWYAARLKNNSLLWNEKEFVYNIMQPQPAERLLPLLMIWGSNTNLNAITPPAQKLWTGGGKTPVALMRSSWTDSNAVYVGFKGGSPFVTHGHMDVGSFVMEAEGVRWGLDFGMQDYTPLEMKNIDLWANQQDGQRWEILRYHNLAHNTLTVNNHSQRVDGNAVIIHSSPDSLYMNTYIDMSSLYKPDLLKANRGIAICNKKYVVVRDEIETPMQEAIIRWNFVTGANVKLSGSDEAILTKNGKTLTIRVQEPAGVTMQTWSTDSPREYDDRNPGTIMVGFEIKVPAYSKRALNVLLIPGNEKINSKATLPLSKW